VVDVLLGGWSAAGRARVLQAAVDGRWEASRSVAVPADESSARALVRDAGPDDADVAVEFEWLGHPLVFVGARRAGDPAAFTAGVVAVAAGDSADPLVALAALAGGPPEELDHLELGAANAWRSVGPLRLWTRGDDGVEPGSKRGSATIRRWRGASRPSRWRPPSGARGSAGSASRSPRRPTVGTWCTPPPSRRSERVFAAR
jgi:hypothetical protein